MIVGIFIGNHSKIDTTMEGDKGDTGSKGDKNDRG